MKVLIIKGFLHHKNEEGFVKILNYLKIEYKNGGEEDIKNYDIIYSPSRPIDTSKYIEKKFIFGPHFSVFPTRSLLFINNINNNSIYIQPSKWAEKVWSNMGANTILPIKVLPLPVNIEKFKPIDNIKKGKVFIYFKRRNPEELEFLKCELDKRNVEYIIFDYIKRYKEEDYLKYLQYSKYGIILDAHESQGFAIEEAMSCNVPLLVWSATKMNQEYGSSYEAIPCTSVPYWDERCGEIFYNKNEFKIKYDEFISKLETYKPREYVLENLGVEKCAENFHKLL
mgnify:CR=1 FL=1